MPWSELRLITPGMFIELEKQRTDAAKERLFGFRFLATVVARVNGADVDFMEDVEDRPLISLDDTEVYFKALSEARERRDGTRASDQGREPNETPVADVETGNGD